MSNLVSQVIEGVAVPEDAYHPMVYGDTCLRCGGTALAPGCASRNLGKRVSHLRARGLCDYICDLLATTDEPEDLRRAELTTDAEVLALNDAAAKRA